VTDEGITTPTRRGGIRLNRVVFVLLLAVLAIMVVRLVVPKVQLILATTRSAPAYSPPVRAGQLVLGACTGGFYARDGSRIVLTMSAHCGDPGMTVTTDDGAVVGVEGPRAQLANCPAGRFCSPSDFMPMVLEAAQVPWGHLNLVDFTGGGYRTIAPGTAPLACGDIHVGDKVEVGGRNWYRSGKVIQLDQPYAFTTDVIFPCMFITDIEAGVGDSGGAVLVNGLPGGITAREIDGYLGFTPLAEGLANLNLTLCTDPDCGLAPPGGTGGG
jgi:hypothetical protein